MARKYRVNATIREVDESSERRRRTGKKSKSGRAFLAILFVILGLYILRHYSVRIRRAQPSVFTRP